MQYSQPKISRFLWLLSCLLFITACDNSPIDHLTIDPDYQRQITDTIPETETKLRSATISQVQYDVNLDLTQMNRYAGTVDIRFLYQKTDYPLTIDFAGGEIERVWLNNAIIGLDYNGHFLSVPSSLMNEGNNRIKIQFSRRYSHDQAGLNRYYDPADQQVYLYQVREVQKQHNFFPMFDQQDMQFNISAMITTDKAWNLYTSLAQTKLDHHGDFKLWHLSADAITSDALSLVAGDWHEWQGRGADSEIRVLVRKSLKDLIPIRRWYQRIQQQVETLSDYFDNGDDNSLVIALLPGLYSYQASVGNQLQLSEHPLLFQFDMTPPWEQLLVEHYVSIGLNDKHYNEHWTKTWLVARLRQYLSNSSEQITSGSMAQQMLQPGQPIISNQYQQSLDILSNLTLNQIKAPLVLDGLLLTVSEEQYISPILNYISSPSARFSSLLDEFESISGLTAHSWASQWLATGGVNHLVSTRDCADGYLTEIKLTQHPMSEFPIIRPMRITLSYLQNERIKTVMIPMTSESVVSREFDNIACESAVIIQAEPAVPVRTDNRSDHIRLLSQFKSSKSFVSLLEVAMYSQGGIDTAELIEWIHLTRGHLDSLSVDEMSRAIDVILKLMNDSATMPEALIDAKLRLSDRLLQMTLNKSLVPNLRIQYFKFHLLLANDNSQADYLFNWFIGKAEPMDLNPIESLQLATLSYLNRLNHRYFDLLLDYYKERRSTLYRPYLSAIELTHDEGFKATDYLQELLDNNTQHAAEFMPVLVDESFADDDTEAVLSFILSKLDLIERRIGSRMLQLWLEPLLLNSCQYRNLITRSVAAIEQHRLNRVTKIWSQEIPLTCQLFDITHTIGR